MRLSDLAAGAPPVPLSNIGAFKDLAVELQNLMAGLGVLDPPADGAFGPASRWALGETLEALDLPAKPAIDREVATKLLGVDPQTLFALNAGNDFAGRIARSMATQGYWLCRHPGCVNIVYIEGCNLDGTPNDNAPNVFNDVRLALRVGQPTGAPQIVKAWQATTEPGRFYTENPMDPNGAARIALQQFKSWCVGIHGTGANAHEALVQVADITVYRDKNKDYRRAGDLPYTGLFGVDQHWGYDLPTGDIQNASAGCLVGRLKQGHVEFMKIIKGDARYKQNAGYRFMTTIIAASAL